LGYLSHGERSALTWLEGQPYAVRAKWEKRQQAQNVAVRYTLEVENRLGHIVLLLQDAEIGQRAKAMSHRDRNTAT
jgi:hypothetical protein